MTITKLTITKSQFTKLETVIETGLRTFYEVGSALKKIRDSRAYKHHLGFETFEEYCRERFDMERAHAYRHIECADVLVALSPMGDIVPANERQCRPLTKLQPDQQVEAWQTVLGKADGGTITAKLVADVVKEVLGETIASDGPKAFDEYEAAIRLRDWLRAELKKWPDECKHHAAHWIKQIVEKEFNL